ncbi:unnamed protein product [Amaranthus hypochondriacus]
MSSSSSPDSSSSFPPRNTKKPSQASNPPNALRNIVTKTQFQRIELTLEFLSSFEVMHFRIRNRDYSLRDDQLVNILGIENHGNLDLNQHYHALSLFRLLISIHVRNVRDMKMKAIHHPSIRIWLRFMADMFCHKAEANKVTTKDMYILAGALRSRELTYPINLTKSLIESFKDIIHSSGVLQAINIGGIITRIAVSVAGFVEPPLTELDRLNCLINIPHMVKKKDLIT